MENIQKAIVAVIMAVLLLIETWFGWKSEYISEEWILSILAILTPFLVWLIPNKS